MPNLSVAGTGMYVVIVEFILHLLNIEAPEGSILAAINGVMAVAGLILWLIGQLRRKDLHFGLVRK